MIFVGRRRLTVTCRACSAEYTGVVRVIRRLVELPGLPGCSRITTSTRLDPSDELLLGMFLQAHAGPFRHTETDR